MSDFDLSHGLAVASRVDGLDAKLTAVLHDAVEDGACTLDDLRQAELPENVVAAIIHLTRADEPYAEYIERLRTCGDELAVYVKLADLETNLARIDDEHASLTGRYRRALSELRGA